MSQNYFEVSKTFAKEYSIIGISISKLNFMDYLDKSDYDSMISDMVGIAKFEFNKHWQGNVNYFLNILGEEDIWNDHLGAGHMLTFFFRHDIEIGQ